jgi:hypothetical protein
MEMRVGFSRRYRRWWWVLRLSEDDPPLSGWATSEAEAWSAVIGLTFPDDADAHGEPA